MDDIYLKVNSKFYSIQSEGARAGTPALFIRLAGCNMDCPFCASDCDEYQELSLLDLLNFFQRYFPCRTIVWTGGEPTLQLTPDIINYFKSQGYKQIIETNGSKKVPAGIDYIAVSPKVPTFKLKQNFPQGVNEIRYLVLTKTWEPPLIASLPRANHYYLSPVLHKRVVRKDLFLANKELIDHTIQMCKSMPDWKFSTQLHKLLEYSK
jgi:organic radical activating enzyme